MLHRTQFALASVVSRRAGHRLSKGASRRVTAAAKSSRNTVKSAAAQPVAVELPVKTKQSYPSSDRSGLEGGEIAEDEDSTHQDHRTAGKLHFDASKAGLQEVDKDYVEQVIQEASKGSAFYQKEQRREEARRRKAEELQRKAETFHSLSKEEMEAIKTEVNCIEADLEATRDLRRRYIHIDMDMFYAAVEEKKNPSLRGIPFGVGSQQMLATTNYIARQYGVRSGMPGFIGKKLCPDMVFVPTDFPAYRREAASVHSIASRYDAEFVSVGLDELTMDVTKYLMEFPSVSAADVANDFRDEVFNKTKLTCSGGIGPTSILAKIASNVNKPNGQHEITLLTRDDVIDYMKDIPLRKIPGIGYAQELTLNALNIHTCGDLLKEKYLLAYLFRRKTFVYYLMVGLGIVETFSQRQHQSRQSVGKEVSFSDPLPTEESMIRLFRLLLEECHVRCVRDRLFPQQLRLVLKYRSFDNQQFSIGLPRPTNDLKIWLEASRKLLAPHLDQYAEYRLVGVRLQKFADAEAGTNGSGADDALMKALSEADDDEEDGEDPDLSDHGHHEDSAARAAVEQPAAPRRDGASSSKTATSAPLETTTPPQPQLQPAKPKKAAIPVSKFLGVPLNTNSGVPPKKMESVPVKLVRGTTTSARKQIKSTASSTQPKIDRLK